MRKICVLNSVGCRVNKLTDVRADGLHQRLLCMPTGSTLNAPTGCLFNAQRAKPKWTKGKRNRKGMRNKRDRDKPKPNPNPTLTLSPLSFKLTLKWCYGLQTYMKTHL